MIDERNRRRPEFERRREDRLPHERDLDADYDRFGHSSDAEPPRGGRDAPYGRTAYPGDVGRRWPEDRARRDLYGRDMYPGNSSREAGNPTLSGDRALGYGPHRGHGPRDYTRPDARIHEDVCDHLAEDADVDAREIAVAVSNGEVTLNGTVPERAHKRRAEDLAEGIVGVRNVQNNLRVSEAGRRDAEPPTPGVAAPRHH